MRDDTPLQVRVDWTELDTNQVSEAQLSGKSTCPVRWRGVGRLGFAVNTTVFTDPNPSKRQVVETSITRRGRYDMVRIYRDYRFEWEMAINPSAAIGMEVDVVWLYRDGQLYERTGQAAGWCYPTKTYAVCYSPRGISGTRSNRVWIARRSGLESPLPTGLDELGKPIGSTTPVIRYELWFADEPGWDAVPDIALEITEQAILETGDRDEEVLDQVDSL